jgi:hypothetical protein
LNKGGSESLDPVPSPQEVAKMDARTRRIGTKTFALATALLLATGIVPALAEEQRDEEVNPVEQPLYPQDDPLEEYQQAGGQGGGGGVGTQAVTGLEFLMIAIRLAY